MAIFDEPNHERPSLPARLFGGWYVRPDRHGILNTQPGLQYPGDPYLMKMDQQNLLLKALAQPQAANNPPIEEFAKQFNFGPPLPAGVPPIAPANPFNEDTDAELADYRRRKEEALRQWQNNSVQRRKGVM